MKRYMARKFKVPFLCVRCIFLAILFILCGSFGVFAQSHDILYPCFVDLPGWKGDTPEGIKMDLPGMKMINAHREYSQGDKELNAVIIIGNPQMAGVQAPQQDMGKIETDKIKMFVDTIKGYLVQVVFDKVDKSGGITVILLSGKDGGAFFTMTYEGMTDSDALNLVKKFDWDIMKRKALQFK